PLLVPDPDRIRVVLVLGLRYEREPAAGVEALVAHGLGTERDARHGHHEEARVFPLDALAGGGVAEAEPGAAPVPLEPQPQPFPHVQASSRSTACTPSSSLTICVTRRSTTTLARASASSAGRPCSRPISKTIPSTAFAAAAPRSRSKPKVSQAPSIRAHGQSS